MSNTSGLGTEAFEEKFTRRFSADLMRMVEAVQTAPIKLNLMEYTWPTAKQADPMPEPTFREASTWLAVGTATYRGRVRVEHVGGGAGGG